MHGTTQSSGRYAVENSVKEPGTKGKPRSKQPLLPSPKDMLTGALPSRGRESPYYSHLLKSDSYLPAVRSLSGKPQSKTQRGDVQPYHRQSFAQINPDDQSLPLLLPEMSSLEQDPAAFIAAAGLNMLSAGTGLPNPHESTVNPRLGVLSAWPAASTIPAMMFPDPGTYDTGFEGSSQPVTVQPRMLVRDPSEFGSREAAPFALGGTPIPSENYRSLGADSQLATATAKGKRKSTAPSSDIYTSANKIIGLGGDIVMTEPTKPMREMIVNDWVKKQKLAKTKVANLKGRGRTKRSLVVVLRLSRESWIKWEEQKVEPDLVMKELVLRDGRVHRILVDKRGSGDVSADRRSASATVSTSEYTSGGAELKKRGRGRPRKNPSLVPPDVGQDDEGDDEDEDEEELEVIPQRKGRREGALRARKREEEARAEAANAIENEKRATEKAIEDEENTRLKAIEDKEKAWLKAIEDEKRAIEEEKQRIEDEKQRIADEKTAAEEEKRLKEEERLQAIEDEKNRRDAERRKAYQEAKMMAAKTAEGKLDGGWGYDSEEEYEQEQYQEEEEEEEEDLRMTEEELLWDEREKYWWESELPGSSFAVVIERRPGYNWKSQYINDAELALRTGESNKPIISTPPSTAKSPKSKQPPMNTRDIRKSMASAATAVGDTSPITQSRRKSTGATTATKITLPQKRTAGSNLDPDDEFIAPGNWSLRKKHVQKAHATRRSGPSESPKDGLRERRAITKYSGVTETSKHRGNWNAGTGISDGDDDTELVEAVRIKDEDVEIGDGYDDRWKRGGQRRVW